MSFVVGLFLSLLSSTTGFAALNIQRHAQRRENPRPGLNALGVLLNLVVGPTDMIAYSFAPQSLLAPVGTFSLVLNLVAAPRLHGDAVTRRDAAATVMIVIGTAICLLYGARGSCGGQAGGDCGGGTGSASAPTALAFRCYAVCVCTVCAGLASLLGKLREHGGRADAVTNAVLAGVLGSMTVVAGKGIGEALKAAMPLRVVAALIPLAGLAPTHLYILNRGMGRHSSVVFVPMNVAAGLLANIASGFLLYGEAPAAPAQFLFGTTLLLAGVLSLAGGKEAAEASPDLGASVPPMPRSLSYSDRGDTPTAARQQHRLPTLSPPSQPPIPDGVSPELEVCEDAEEGTIIAGYKDGVSAWSVLWVAKKLSGRRRRPTWASEKPKHV